MESNGGWLGLIKEIRGDCFPDIGAQMFPVIRLRENVVGKAFRHQALIGFLCHRKYDFHTG